MSSNGRMGCVTASLLAPYAVLALGTAVVLLAHWPGRLNTDSRGMLAGVRGDLPIVDHWSATLTWAWQAGHELVGLDTGGVFLLQTLALVVGIYLVLRSSLRRLTAAVLTVLVVLAPPAFGFVGLVGRDAWFVSSCVFAVGLATAAVRWTRPAHVAAAILVGTVAAATAITARQNGFTAVGAALVALAVPAFELGRKQFGVLQIARRSPLAYCAVGVVATTSILATSMLTDRLLRDRALHPETLTYLYDLAYLTLETNRQLIPSMPHEAVGAQTQAEVRQLWDPASAGRIRVGAWPASQRVRLVLTSDEVARIGRAWRKAVFDHPENYLQGRLGLWRRQLGIGHTPAYVRATHLQPDEYGYESPSFPRLSDVATEYAQMWGTGPTTGTVGGAIHHVWAYLLVCVLGLLLALPRFALRVRLAAALPAAAIGLQAGLFFMAPAAEWRFQLLTVYAAMIVVVLAASLAIEAWLSVRRSAEPALPMAMRDRF